MFGKTKDEWKDLDGIHTAKEIEQQPRLWSEVLQIFENKDNDIEAFLERTFYGKDVDVIFTGAGTSAYVGDFITPYIRKNNEGNFKSIATTDLVSNPYMYLTKTRPTILVNFARSGNSPESVASVKLANQLVDEIYHIFITCNKDGELAKISEKDENALLILMPEESNDKSFAMTSSFTCMTLTATLIFDKSNRKNNLIEIEKLVNKAELILETAHEDLADMLNKDFERIVYLGSGPYHGIAKESALKLLELTRGFVVGYSETTLGFRHGPKSILNDKTINLVYLSNDDYARDYDFDIAKEMYHDAGDHQVVLFGYSGDTKYTENSDLYVNVDIKLKNDVFLGLLYVLYAQVFSLIASVKHGINPDNPNPSGAVNRVVQGVNIYDYK